MEGTKISTEVSADEIPEGFTAADPNNPDAASAAGGGGASAAAAAQAEAAQAQRDAILAQALTPEALARLRRIKLVKPEKAKSVENAIASMAMQGKLPGPINEGKLVEMLERGAGTGGAAGQAKAGSGAVSIQRKKYAFDSDDDDDNDDDLL
jgi:programmed cell death protein 5